MPETDQATASKPLPTSRTASATPPAGAGLAVLVGLLALLLHFLRFGYSYGSGAQDRFLPLVLRRLDPTLLSSDWYVNIESAHPGFLMPFVMVLQGLARPLSLWLGVLVLHVGTLFALAAAIYLLARLVTGGTAAAILATLIALVLKPHWTLGGSVLASDMLLPDTVAWAAAFWSVLYHLRERPLVAGLLMGIAFLLHPFSALFPLCLVFAHLVTQPALRWHPRVHRTLLTLLGFLVTASPTLVRLRILTLTDPGGNEAYPSLFYILAEFGNPVLDAGQFPAHEYGRFAVLLVLGVLGFAWMRRSRMLPRPDFLFVGLNVLAVFLVLGYLFTETAPVLLFTRLELFRATTFAVPLLVAGVVGGLLQLRFVRRLGSRLEQHADVLTRNTLILVSIVIALLSLSERALLGRVHPLAHHRTGLGVVEDWAARATDVRATFLVPPSVSTFRTNARRSIVVNYEGAPSSPVYARTWFQRLLSIAPVPFPDHARTETLPTLDAAYATQSPTRLAALALQYNAEFVLVNRQIADPDRLLEVFSSGEWHVYLPVEMPGPRLTHLTRRSSNARE